MIRISHRSKSIKGVINLPSSKSISNRMLMLKKLYEPSLVLENLSEANDTQLLKDILDLNNEQLDVQDAGSAFRFLVAYCSVTPGVWEIKGTERLHQRPIVELVDALKLLGADIEYQNKEGFAPLKIKGKTLEAKEIIDLSFVRSSQFISALLMIAPLVKGKFELKINRKMNSFSYVVLTISAMRRMGFSVVSRGAFFSVSKERKFEGEYFLIEPDWTSFYYWYAIAHLSKSVDLLFPGINQSNMSKERKKLFYVGNRHMYFEDTLNGFHIKKNEGNTNIEFVENYKFDQFPDLAPTFAMLLPALGCVKCEFRGLESLKYKECDREEAIKVDLNKMKSSMTFKDKIWEIDASEFSLERDTIFESFDDHRMVMSIAPLALIKPLIIKDEHVVKKSYPNFWSDLESVGFEIEYL